MFAFSTCWNSHRHTDGRAMLNEIRALGFEYAELSHGTRVSLIDGIQRAVVNGEIKICSLHNFCPLPFGVNGPSPDYYLPSSRDERERELAVRHTLRTLECAAMVGAKAVVMHLGRVPTRHYTRKLIKLQEADKGATPKFQRVLAKCLRVRERKHQKYFDQVCRTLDQVVPRARQLKLKLGFETRHGLEEIPNEEETGELLARFGSDTACYWHDIGHAQLRENFGLTSHETLLKRFSGQTAGMHLQDFSAPDFDHQPPGFGTFDFSRLTPFLSDDMILPWEIHPEWRAEQIVEAVKGAHAVMRPPVTT
jgi:sugar phosphate isomerase/epimerase